MHSFYLQLVYSSVAFSTVYFCLKSPLFKFNAVSLSLMQHIFCEKENLAKQRLHKIYLAYKDNPTAILKILDDCVVGCRKCSEIYFSCELDSQIEKKRLVRNFSPEKIFNWKDLYDDEVFAEYQSARNYPSAYVGFKAVLFLLREKVKNDEMWKKVDLEAYVFDGSEKSVFFGGKFEKNIILARALRTCFRCKNFIMQNSQDLGTFLETWYKELINNEADALDLELRNELFKSLLELLKQTDLHLERYKFIFQDIIKVSDPAILFENIHYFAKLGLKQRIFAEMKDYDLNSARSIVRLSNEIDFATFFLNRNIIRFYEFLSLNNVVALNKGKMPEMKSKFQNLVFNTVQFLAKCKSSTKGDKTSEDRDKIDTIEFICGLDWRSYGDLVESLLYLRWFFRPFVPPLRISMKNRKSDILTSLGNKKKISSEFDDQKYILEIMHDALNLRGKDREVGIDLSKYVRMTPRVAIDFIKSYGTDEEMLRNLVDGLLIQEQSFENFCNILQFSAPELLKNLKAHAILHGCGHNILRFLSNISSQAKFDEMIIITSSSESLDESLEIVESSTNKEFPVKSKQIKINVCKSSDRELAEELQPANKTLPSFASDKKSQNNETKQTIGFINIKKRKVESTLKANENSIYETDGRSKLNCDFGKLKKLAAKINENNTEKEAVIIDKRSVADVKLVDKDLCKKQLLKEKQVSKMEINSGSPEGPSIRQMMDKFEESTKNEIKDGTAKGLILKTESALTKSIADRCDSLFNNSKSYKAVRTVKSDDGVFYKNILARPAENINEFYEESLNPLIPSYKFPYSSSRDTFLSYAEYLAYWNILRANENKSSILSEIFEYSKYETAIVHVVNGGVSVRTSKDALELQDILFFSTRKVNFRNESKECLLREMAEGSFLGIIKHITALHNGNGQEYRNMIDIQVSENTKKVVHGQFYYFKSAGNLVTSFREFTSLFSIHKSSLLKYILRPSFHQDNLERQVFWDDKRNAIIVNPMASQQPSPVTCDNENTAVALQTMLINRHALNFSQASAVAHSFFSHERFCLIQGPPGTGKTTTILSIISNFLFLNKSDLSFDPSIMLNDVPQRRILICAPSNTAIDIIVLRLAGGLKNFCGQKIQVPFVRIGNSPNSVVSQYTLESIANSEFKNIKAKLRSRILARSAIICSTLSSSMSEYMADYKFDLVIIDEACQSIELSAIIPLRYNPEKVIIIGDPCQLPPTVISNQPLLERSLFERMAAYHKPMLLDTQYRMDSSICDLSSTFFYSHEIKTCSDLRYLRDKSRGYTLSIDCDPVSFIDIPSFNEKLDGSKSFFNYTEASLCLTIWKKFRQKYKNVPSIAILSPYKAQVAVLKTLAQFNGDAVDISTIDAYQGKEADVVILSTVRQTGLGFTSDFRRINVAITRARECLIILGNPECLCKNKIWAGIINFNNLERYSYCERFQFFDKI